MTPGLPHYNDYVILSGSTIRQIPDNQEVWLEKDSDASLIIELVQIPCDLADRDAFAQYNPLPPINQQCPYYRVDSIGNNFPTTMPQGIQLYTLINGLNPFLPE